jgi:hypothetical protein
MVRSPSPEQRSASQRNAGRLQRDTLYYPGKSFVNQLAENLLVFKTVKLDMCFAIEGGFVE